MEGGGDRSSWLRRGRDGDRSNRLGRGRDGGVDGGGRRGSSPSTRETAAPNPNAREGDVRKETGDGTGAARQDTRWRLVGKFCSVLRAKREILRKRTAKAEKHLRACFARDVRFRLALPISAFAPIPVWLSLSLLIILQTDWSVSVKYAFNQRKICFHPT
jgi:hypothetical protein